ncbi:Protein Transport Protein Sec31A [Manis pentadactyla]|nr:Protein Transport Protein Sec31A [Manis pentadactyla]
MGTPGQRPARRRGLPEPLASSSCPVPWQPRQPAALGGASPGAERGAGGPLGGPSSGLGFLGDMGPGGPA